MYKPSDHLHVLLSRVRCPAESSAPASEDTGPWHAEVAFVLGICVCVGIVVNVHANRLPCYNHEPTADPPELDLRVSVVSRLSWSQKPTFLSVSSMTF